MRKKATSESILLFELSGQLYGIPLSSVVEIILLPPKIHSTEDSSWDGEILYRKKQIPLMDLPKRFGYFAHPKYAVIVEDGEETWGLMIPSIKEVLTYLPPENFLDSSLPCIEKVYSLEGKLILTMDLIQFKRGLFKNEENSSSDCR